MSGTQCVPCTILGSGDPSEQESPIIDRGALTAECGVMTASVMTSDESCHVLGACYVPAAELSALHVLSFHSQTNTIFDLLLYFHFTD